MSNLYVAPTSSGTGDGSSAANAAAITQLPSLVQQAGAGGTVMLLADRGAYSVTDPIILDAGGTAGAPVTIKGVSSSGAPMNAQIVGDRAANWTQGAAEGEDAFRLMNGADNIAFENLSFSNVANAVRAGADVSNLTITHATAQNVAHFMENYVSGSNSTATISGLTIDDVSVTGYAKSVVRLQYDSHNIVVKNTTGDSQGVDGGFAMGIALDGTVHDVVLSHVTMNNNVYTQADYWNGDGFVTESNVYNVLFDHTVASGNGDSGYDIKSAGTVLDSVVSQGNNRNFKFWAADTILQNSTGLDPHHLGGNGSQSQIWLGDDAAVKVINSTFSDSSAGTTVFNLDQSHATLSLENVTVSKADAAALSVLYDGSQLIGSPVVTGPGSDPTATVEPAPSPALASSIGPEAAASDPITAAPAPSLDPGIVISDTTPAPVPSQESLGTLTPTEASQTSLLDPPADSAGTTDTGWNGGRLARWATAQGLLSDHQAIDQQLSDAAFVQGLYQHAAGRHGAPSAAESAAALLTGSPSPADVTLGVAAGSEAQTPFAGTDAPLV